MVYEKGTIILYVLELGSPILEYGMVVVWYHLPPYPTTTGLFWPSYLLPSYSYTVWYLPWYGTIPVWYGMVWYCVGVRRQ
jgi:hypothetical protein